MIDREKVIHHFEDAIEASDSNDKWVFVRVDILEDSITLLKADQTYLLQKDEEIARLNRELDAMNRLSEMQMEALQEAEHDHV